MRVLCIDDCYDVLELLSSYLELAGIRNVDLCDNPLNLKSRSIKSADLIICDIVMPHRKGDEIFRNYCSLLRNGDTNSKFFVLTGSPMEALSLNSWAELSGADEIITKPLIYGDFIELMQKYYLISPSAGISQKLNQKESFKDLK